MNEFIEQFLIEGRELVAQASGDLLELEQRPADKERLDSAFRAFHTLKGAAGIIEFAEMARTLHVVEDALSAVRTGKRTVSTSMVNDCLACLDQITAWFGAMEVSEDIPADTKRDADRIIARFEATDIQMPLVGAKVGGPQAAAYALIGAQLALVNEPGDEMGRRGRLASAIRVTANVFWRMGQVEQSNRISATSPVDRDDVVATLQDALASLDAANETSDVGSPVREESVVRALRIDVARIDALVKLTGELTTTKNAIGHVADMAKDGADPAQIAASLREQYASLDRLVGELQQSVLNVRVLPMRHVFQRFPRLVREISAELDKPARLITEGDETEADKAIVEALFEPLLHLVRNAIDHGVEDATVRAAREKPATAKVVLRATRAGGRVIIEVEDDGGGIDVARVRELAVARRVAPAEAIGAMSDADAVNLIFTPGFSTAGRVTALSGRGVGMDAVRSSVEASGGQVFVENRPQRGTLVRLALPFTLVMTRVMTVQAGPQMFGIPFDAIVETVRVPRAHISPVGAARAFAYRQQTVPLIDLPAALGAGVVQSRVGEAIVVVTNVAGELSAFEVDGVGSSLDIMLSPLEGLVSGVRGVAGATLLGDGAVLIVLDLQELTA